MSTAPSANNVGILAMEVYFPSTYVSQADLEVATGASKGKYTIGLGQANMAFTGDREDINSIALTVVQSLLEKYRIDPKDVGRLEVGTESLVDKSKSTKTVLMTLFADSGNTDIEGATVVNACYGGTAALLNALTWADAPAWNGKYAIVVAADIAVYADGPARPTGGCGAVAMLVGRDAPVRVNLLTRVTHACHVWDFFKPNMDSEYPEVNGALSQTCYLRAIDDCYVRFIARQEGHYPSSAQGVHATDFFLFHSPYNKLVQKSFARVLFHEMRAGRVDGGALGELLTAPLESTYEDKTLEAKLKDLSLALYSDKVATGCEISRQIGNTYTACVYMNLANLISEKGSELAGKKTALFSYGSGALASMFEITASDSASSPFTLQRMQQALSVASRLASRQCSAPEELAAALQARERSHGHVPFAPTYPTAGMFPGTFYLDSISETYERTYKRV